MTNDQEVTMNDDTTPGLIALRIAKQAAGKTLRMARTIPAPLRCLADQVIRSSTSVSANLAEGAGRAGRDRIHHWRMAYASALETSTHIEELVDDGAVDRKLATEILALEDRVRALTWRLVNPRW